MSWFNTRMRNLDGRIGRVVHESPGFGHVGLQVQVDKDVLSRDDDVAEKVWIQLNSFGEDSGEIGWYWWSNDFMGKGGWLLLGDHNPDCMRPSEPGKLALFTPANLMALSRQAEITYERLLEQNPPGTFHSGRNLARVRMLKTQLCANWMQTKGIASITHVGHLGDLPTKGQKVRLPVNTVVKSWGGAEKSTQEVLGRRQTVTIGYVNAGGTDDHDQDENLGVRQATIQWSGTGQRYRSAEIVGLQILG